MITYETNLNCDGQNCKILPVTALHKNSITATLVVLARGRRDDWVIIDGEHYCPDCAEIIKPSSTN